MDFLFLFLTYCSLITRGESIQLQTQTPKCVKYRLSVTEDEKKNRSIIPLTSDGTFAELSHLQPRGIFTQKTFLCACTLLYSLLYTIVMKYISTLQESKLRIVTKLPIIKCTPLYTYRNLPCATPQQSIPMSPVICLFYRYLDILRLQSKKKTTSKH